MNRAGAAHLVLKVTGMAPPRKSGLRERKKHLTRETIADAALALSVERGLGNVTVEEIADLAFVSPRTVSNYFSCKEEAVARAGSADLLAPVDRLADRPPNQPVLEALREVFVDLVGSWSAQRLAIERQKLEIERAHPGLHPYLVAQFDELEAALREAIAARTGLDANTDVYPWVTAAAAVSAVSSALRLWVRSGAPAQALPGVVEEAFDEIMTGLQSPPTATDRPPTA